MAKFAEYKRFGNHDVTKDGHTMFIEDIVKDLQRKSFLEGEVVRLKKLDPNVPECNKGID